MIRCASRKSNNPTIQHGQLSGVLRSLVPRHDFVFLDGAAVAVTAQARYATRRGGEVVNVARERERERAREREREVSGLREGGAWPDADAQGGLHHERVLQSDPLAPLAPVLYHDTMYYHIQYCIGLYNIIIYNIFVQESQVEAIQGWKFPLFWGNIRHRAPLAERLGLGQD